MTNLLQLRRNLISIAVSRLTCLAFASFIVFSSVEGANAKPKRCTSKVVVGGFSVSIRLVQPPVTYCKGPNGNPIPNTPDAFDSVAHTPGGQKMNHVMHATISGFGTGAIYNWACGPTQPLRLVCDNNTTTTGNCDLVPNVGVPEESYKLFDMSNTGKDQVRLSMKANANYLTPMLQVSSVARIHKNAEHNGTYYNTHLVTSTKPVIGANGIQIQMINISNVPQPVSKGTQGSVSEINSTSFDISVGKPDVIGMKYGDNTSDQVNTTVTDTRGITILVGFKIYAVCYREHQTHCVKIDYYNTRGYCGMGVKTYSDSYAGDDFTWDSCPKDKCRTY